MDDKDREEAERLLRAAQTPGSELTLINAELSRIRAEAFEAGRAAILSAAPKNEKQPSANTQEEFEKILAKFAEGYGLTSIERAIVLNGINRLRAEERQMAADRAVEWLDDECGKDYPAMDMDVLRAAILNVDKEAP